MILAHELPVHKFEIHYLLDKNSHSFDAQARLVCENEFLGVLKEVTKHFDVEISVEAEALAEGGVRNRWILKGKDALLISAVMSMLFAGISAVATSIEAYNSYPTEKEERIQELQIKKLEKELELMGVSEEQSESSAQKVIDLENNNKVKKRRSNLYSSVKSVDKVTNVGFTALDLNNIPTFNEIIIPKQDFGKFILHTDLLADETDESALIEIVSPVFKEGKSKWRGIYDGELISFNMKDSGFKKDVLLGKHTFQHGTMIEAVLVIEKELDETGEEKVTNRSVTTVLKKIDGDSSQETVQGKQYKHEKKAKSAQQEIAFNKE